MAEIALVARARGLARHLLARETLETLAEADDVEAFARRLSRLDAATDPVAEPYSVFAVERAIGRTANRHLRTLYRWQEGAPGVLDVFAAHQDRRSLRALPRGAAQGAPSEARLEGLLPTPSLPQLALTELAHQASPAGVVGHLVLVSHPDVPRLLPLVRRTQVDLLALDAALLSGFADRTTRAAAGADEATREFVGMLIDLGNAQNALLMAGEPRDFNPGDVFVAGGRWLTASAFVSAAARASRQQALTALTAALARSPLAPALPVVESDLLNLDRAFLGAALKRLTYAARLAPLSTAPLLRVLLLIEAQSRDLRMLAWSAAFGAPPSLRRQQLVTPG
jgi:vacuolar-type H+-ATPase subunit C/Vma6